MAKPIPFPFLFGGTFIEGANHGLARCRRSAFPFLFGGTFIEGHGKHLGNRRLIHNFPSFSEGLSLRAR